jgi:molecular chaperone DnaJ
MAKRDFYDTLGVAKSADAEELKRAYRKLAMQWHPDRNPGDKSAEHKFKDISEAYDVLKDDQKRAAYDRFGHAAFENGSRGPGDGGFAGGFSGGFADIFEEMFGAMGAGRRTQNGPARGSDLRYNIEVSLEDAFRGKQTAIRVASFGHCDTCNGSGAEPGSRPASCRTCQGSGLIIEKPC